MGQRANSGRNATLDEQKRRAAGRRERSPEREAIADASNRKPAKGKTGGAFGTGAKRPRRGTAVSQGAGGGGSAQSAARGSVLSVGRSTKRARKR